MLYVNALLQLADVLEYSHYDTCQEDRDLSAGIITSYLIATLCGFRKIRLPSQSSLSTLKLPYCASLDTLSRHEIPAASKS